MTTHPFTDPLSHTVVQLVIGDDQASTGVAHDGCEQLADVSPELDSAFCGRCHWQCRISGAWFMDVLAAEDDEGGQERQVRICNGCGCTDDYGCDGGCWWVAADLCSACQPPTPQETPTQ